MKHNPESSFFDSLNLPVTDPVLVFAILLAVVLISPLLLRKLKIPGIIGLILLGVLIGPNTLNILENNEAIDLFSTIGLLYIMFIAGLDLDLNEFSRSRYRSVGFGLMTFAIPFILGFLVFHFLLEYNTLASILISSVFSTQTLVAYPLVSKLGLTHNRAVVVAVGGTIITDTLVLILLAVITGIDSGGFTALYFVWLMVGMALVTVFLFLLLPPISRWFFRKLQGDQNAQFVFVLMMVFLAGYLTKLAGIEPIVGAFFAGLVFNRIIPRASLLMNRLMFIGNAMFIPFFLIGIGMIVDLRVVTGDWSALWLALILVIVAFAGKWLAAWLSAVGFGYNKTERNLLFGLSSSHAAATLAIILVGFQKGIVDDAILNGTILLVLVSCLIAVLVTEQTAKKALISGDLKAKSLEPLRQNERIMIPVANWNNLPSFLEFALWLGSLRKGSSVHVLSVVNNDREAESNLHQARMKLEQFSRMANGTDTEVLTHATIDHDLLHGIMRSSMELQVSTIIMGWPGQGKLAGKFFEPFISRMLQVQDKEMAFCHFPNPLTTIKRLVCWIPDHANIDPSLLKWQSMLKEMAVQRQHPYLALPFTTLNDGDHTGDSEQKIRHSDLLILFSAREGSLSWDPQLTDLPDFLYRKYPKNNLMVLLPGSGAYTSRYSSYQDFDSSLLHPHSLLKRRTN